MTKHAKLLWLDLEMTGLDATYDPICEVAAVVTDWSFSELAEFTGVIKNDDDVMAERLRANGAFWEANQAARAGLLDQNASGKSSGEVESDLVTFIDQHIGPDESVMLAGNSIHIDRRFIVAQWPLLEARLYYRMLDVSAWKVVFENKLGSKFVKPNEHRALGDIRGSIDELKFYLKRANFDAHA